MTIRVALLFVWRSCLVVALVLWLVRFVTQPEWYQDGIVAGGCLALAIGYGWGDR